MKTSSGIKFGFLELAVLFLTVYVLIALVVDTFCQLDPETSKLLTYFDWAICGFFLVEFIVRFNRADNKLKFIKWGWIDLLSAIPMIEAFRVGRLLRLIRLIRVIRAFKSVYSLVTHVFVNRAKGTLSVVSVMAFLVIIFSSIAILEVEDAPHSNITSAEDAIWWTITTITTVGYGDIYPVTTEGRALAAALMIFGIGIFGTFTAYVASFFIGNKSLPDDK